MLQMPGRNNSRYVHANYNPGIITTQCERASRKLAFLLLIFACVDPVVCVGYGDVPNSAALKPL